MKWPFVFLLSGRHFFLTAAGDLCRKRSDKQNISVVQVQAELLHTQDSQFKSFTHVIFHCLIIERPGEFLPFTLWQKDKSFIFVLALCVVYINLVGFLEILTFRSNSGSNYNASLPNLLFIFPITPLTLKAAWPFSGFLSLIRSNGPIFHHRMLIHYMKPKFRAFLELQAQGPVLRSWIRRLTR